MDHDDVVCVSEWSATKEVAGDLARWGLGEECLAIRKFRFHASVMGLEGEAVVRKLFRAPTVRAWLRLGDEAAPVTRVERLKTSATSMALFDPVERSDGVEGSVCAPGGALRQCAHVEIQGAAVHDVLRKRLVRLELRTTVDGSPADDDPQDLGEYEDDDPDDRRGLPDDHDRSEFLFHLFALLAVGGPLAQHDFDLAAYLAVTKVLYRSLLTVYEATKSNQLTVSTQAFRVYGASLFPSANKLQRCYVLVDAKTNALVVLYHPRKLRAW